MSFISRLKSFFSFILHPVKEDTPVKQYCCDKFRFRYEGQKSMGLNIRAIGLTPETAQKMENSTDKVFFGLLKAIWVRLMNVKRKHSFIIAHAAEQIYKNFTIVAIYKKECNT